MCPRQTQVLHDEPWLLAGQLIPRASTALVVAWYSSGRSALLPVECTGELVNMVLFEQTFGVGMPLYMLTCRHAFDDCSFRLDHPEPEDLVLRI